MIVLFDKIKALNWGKRIGTVGWYYLPDLMNLGLCKISNISALDILLKIDFKTHKVSKLWYPGFLIKEHPTLRSSWSNGKLITYKVNRPILHRKELMLDPEHHNLTDMIKLTKREEALGYYKNVLRIGRENYWNDLINGRLT